MPLRSRAWTLGCGAIVLLLLGLAAFLPPDGLEHLEFAQFIGRFHPLAVHIPIALLLLVPVLQIAGFFGQRKELQQAAGFVLALAAISAVGTALLGWMLAWSGGYQGPLVTRHMWGGLFLAAA